MSKIAEVVRLKTGYANFVQLKNAFEESQENMARMAMYRPTTAHRKALARLFRGLYQPNDKKFYLLSGSYGTGKSHLCLMLANLLSRSSVDPEIKGFYENYAELEPEAAKTLKRVLKDGQYLVAICDYTAAKRFEDVVLKAVFDACSDRGLDSEIQTEFHEAERRLDEWDEAAKAGESEIRDFYKDFAKALEKVAPGVSVDQIRTGLKRFDSEALEKFHAAFKKAMGGIEFRPDAGNLITIIKDLVRSKVFKSKFKGLAILFDEFQYTLEQGAYSKDVLQGFMEIICRDEPNVLFVGCIHKDFRAYADRYSKEDVAVMSARMTQVDLLNEGIEEIICAIVEIDRQADAWKEEIAPKTGVFDQLLPPCETLNLFPWISDIKRIRQRVLEDIYGVHPMALACLLRLSSEIGSAARSTFTFFSGDVAGAEGSYPDYIANSEITVEGGKLNLYTADQLALFFHRELTLKNPDLRETQRKLVDGYYASEEALRKAGKEQLLDEEATNREAILKIILLYQLCHIPTTLENIQFGLYCVSKREGGRVAKNLDYLAKTGSLFFRKQSKTYELAVSTGEDPYDLIERYMKDVKLHPEDKVVAFLEEVGSRTELRYLQAKQYNLAFSEDKRLRRYFVRAKDLGKPLWDTIAKEYKEAEPNDRNSYEGGLVYVLCEDAPEVHMAREATAELSLEYVAVGIPYDPHPFVDTLLRVKACKHFLPPEASVKLSAQTEARVRDILEDPLDGYLPKLQKIFDGIESGEGACWHGVDGRVLVDRPKQPHKPADVLCERLYAKRCRIKHPDLNFIHDDKWRTGKNNALRQAVGVLLNAERVMIDNGHPDNHGEKRYLEKVLLKGAGGLRHTESEGSLNYFECESDPAKLSEDFPVLRELCDRIVKLKSGKPLAVGEFIGDMKRPPYGAGGTALMIALGHVIRAFGERLRVFTDSTRTKEYPIGSYDDLVAVITGPAARAVFELRDISDAQRALIEGLADAVGARPLTHGESRSVSAAYDAITSWWHEIPPGGRIIDLFREDQQKSLGKLADILNGLEHADRFNMILSDIPSLYTGGLVGDDMTEEEVKTIVQEFEKDIKALVGGFDRLRNQIADQICTLFGSEGDMIECEKAVSSWFEALNPSQRKTERYADQPDAEAFVRVLSLSEPSFDEKIVKILPIELNLDEVDKWNTLRIEDYIAKLRQAKSAIETEVVVVPLPEIGTAEKAKARGEARWEIESGGVLELLAQKPAVEILYTVDAKDPKYTEDRRKTGKSLAIQELLDDRPAITLRARATDPEGNLSDLLTLRITNKAKEYEVVLDPSDLYDEKATFKFPGAAGDLKTVLRSIVRTAATKRIIAQKKADRILEVLDEILGG